MKEKWKVLLLRTGQSIILRDESGQVTQYSLSPQCDLLPDTTLFTVLFCFVLVVIKKIKNIK